MFKSLQHSAHLTRIAWVLARHDVLSLLAHTNTAPTLQWIGRLIARRDASHSQGQKLVQALTQLGPTFIKLGQTLATRADIVGEDIANELSTLQDRLPPFPFEQAQAIVERELGGTLGDHFDYFNPVPVAAASIAQVHRASSIEGCAVAVKVVRPNVRAAFGRDIATLLWLARWMEHRLPATRRLRPVEVVKTFQQTVMLEMDLRFEAAAASELAENMRELLYFRVPDIDWGRTSSNVLTMSWVEGIPLYETERLVAAGHNLQTLSERIATAFFTQVYRDGFFHADLHPGNLMVNAAGEIVAVDFGIMGRLDKQTRLHLVEMLHGFLTRDYRRVAEVHFDAGWVPADQNLETFAQARRSIAEPILGKPLNEISAAKMLAQLFSVATAFNMHTQPQLLLLQKSLVLTEGIGRLLYPGTNMWALAEPLIREFIGEQLSVKAQVKDRLREGQKLLMTLPSLAVRAEHVLTRIEEQGLKLHTDGNGFGKPSRLSLGLLALSMMALGALLALLVERL